MRKKANKIQNTGKIHMYIQRCNENCLNYKSFSETKKEKTFDLEEERVSISLLINELNCCSQLLYNVKTLLLILLIVSFRL